MRKYPYRIHPDKDGFYFFTSSKIKYKVVFLTPEALWGEYPEIKKSVFDFTFYPEDAQSIQDKRVSVTITSILKRFFKKYPERIITFACDSIDGKEKGRFVLFNKWFDLNNGKKTFIKQTVTHKSEEFNYYAAIIMKANNKNKDLAIKAFVEVTSIYKIS